MSSWLSRKVVRYFRSKAIAQIDADPIGVARRYYKPIIDLLSKDEKIKSLFWAGSYEFSLELIEFFRKYEIIDKSSFDNNMRNKDAESNTLINIFLVEYTDNDWQLAFFVDSLEFSKEFTLLDKFKVNVVSGFQAGSETLSKII